MDKKSNFHDPIHFCYDPIHLIFILFGCIQQSRSRSKFGHI